MPRQNLNGVIRSVVLDPQQLKTLELIAKSHDVSVSWLIRKAVEMMLTHKPSQTTPQGSGE
jgi:predicted DNA-binding ribbon-helix-helix protein